jgi:hypothetical protein
MVAEKSTGSSSSTDMPKRSRGHRGAPRPRTRVRHRCGCTSCLSSGWCGARTPVEAREIEEGGMARGRRSEVGAPALPDTKRPRKNVDVINSIPPGCPGEAEAERARREPGKPAANGRFGVEVIVYFAVGNRPQCRHLLLESGREVNRLQARSNRVASPAFSRNRMEPRSRRNRVSCRRPIARGSAFERRFRRWHCPRLGRASFPLVEIEWPRPRRRLLRPR